MLTIEEVAARLNGREMGEELRSEAERSEIADAGIIVVFGASDDLMEFCGALDDEFGAWNGTTACVHSTGVLEDADGANDDLREEIGRRGVAAVLAKCATIEAKWSPTIDGVRMSWAYETAIPHATFDIMEDGEVYCHGIVFRLADLPVVSELA